MMKFAARALIDRTVKKRSPGSYLLYMMSRRIVSAFENQDVVMDTNGEYWLQKQIAKFCDSSMMVAFDVGANQGEWVQGVLVESENCKVYCYEPVPSTFSRLEAVVSDDRAVLINKALSESSGEVTINSVKDNPYLSSMHDVSFYEDGHDVESIVIQATTGDEELLLHGITHVHFVKVDAEGHDLAVIKGFSRSIFSGCIDVFQFEYNQLTLSAGCTLRDFYNLLSENYVICRLLPSGLEACGYHSSMDTFSQSNWVAVRKAILAPSAVGLLRIRSAKGLPGQALNRALFNEPDLATRLGCSRL